jgi:hypothetical protein
MKNLLFYLLIGLSVLISSCTVTSEFYQVCEIDTEQECVKDSSSFVFEDENCKVIYYFWSEGGNPGFVFYNKTETKIFLNIEDAFFITNGFAQDYFKNRTYTNSASFNTITSVALSNSKYISGVNNTGNLQTNSGSTSTSVGLANNNGYSISYQEPNIICIPPKTAKVIEEFSILNAPYRDCELFRFPKDDELASKEFNSQNSPNKFSNIFTYSLNNDGNIITIENSFYVSRVQNIPSSKMFTSAYQYHCGDRSQYYKKTMNDIAANKFYISYVKPSAYWKH